MSSPLSIRRMASAPELPKDSCTVRPEPPKKGLTVRPESAQQSYTVQPQCCKTRLHWKASRNLGGVFQWERERKAVAKMYIEMYDDLGRPKCRDQSISSAGTEPSEQQQQQQRPQACGREKSEHQTLSSNTSSTTLVGSERWSVTPSERTQHDQDEIPHERLEDEQALDARESTEKIMGREAQWCQLFPRSGYVIWDSPEPGQASLEVEGHASSPKGSPYTEVGSYRGQISWIPETHIPHFDSHISAQAASTLEPERPQLRSKPSILSKSFRKTQKIEASQSTSTLKPERQHPRSRPSRLSMSFQKTQKFEVATAGPETSQYVSSAQSTSTLKFEQPQLRFRPTMLSMSFRKTQKVEIATAGPETSKHVSAWRRSTRK